MTQAQFDWQPCGNQGATSCAETRPKASTSKRRTSPPRRPGSEIPVFTAEDGVEYTPGGSPTDDWYGSQLTPFDGLHAEPTSVNTFVDLNKSRERRAQQSRNGHGLLAVRRRRSSPGLEASGPVAFTRIGSTRRSDSSTSPTGREVILTTQFSRRCWRWAERWIRRSRRCSSTPPMDTSWKRLIGDSRRRRLVAAPDSAHRLRCRGYGLQQQWKILLRGRRGTERSRLSNSDGSSGDGYFQIINGSEKRESAGPRYKRRGHARQSSGGESPNR